jgi:hypothetical protein
MLDLQPLNSLRQQVRTPSYAELTAVARSRDRRAALLAAAGSVAVVVAVVVGALLTTNARDHSAPQPVITPTPRPTPSPSRPPTHHSATSMTPREVVRADDARLQWSAVSADDPDFRVAVWEAECTWCPRSPEDSRFPHPSFLGMAITNDGFATATYRHTGFLEAEEGGLLSINAVSPGPGLLLLVTNSEAGDWLVRDDGTVTRQARSSGPAESAGPRAWFVCLTDFDHLPWENPGTPSVTWCAVDADANTVHVMGGSWRGGDEMGDDEPSMVPPGSGDQRWGVRNQSLQRLVGWWDAGGSRRSKDFGAADASGAIGNAPAGTMSFWAWSKGSPTLTVFTSSDEGASWETSTVAAPIRRIKPWGFDLSWTPDGALLAREDYVSETVPSGPGWAGYAIRLWRSPAPADGAFTKVYEGDSGNPALGPGTPAFTVVGSRIWSKGFWSDDDGMSWTTVPRWR